MDKYNLHNNGTFAADKEVLYVQTEFFKEDRYSLILGERGKRSSRFGFGGAPKFSAMYHLPKGFRLLGGAGLGCRAPNFSALPVPALKRLRPGSGEAGYSLSPLSPGIPGGGIGFFRDPGLFPLRQRFLVFPKRSRLPVFA